MFKKREDSLDPFKGSLLCGNNVSLGEKVFLGGEVFFFGTAPISIGSNTMIGYRVIIHTSTHDYNTHPMWKKRIDRPVEIGKHVWIGAGAIILAGIKIGDYAVVGAGSVVTSHVPTTAIVAGNPARVIKYRSMDEMKKNYEAKQWVSDNEMAIKKTFLDNNNICKNKKFY